MKSSAGSSAGSRRAARGFSGRLSLARTPEGNVSRSGAYGRLIEEWLGVRVRHRLYPHPELRLTAAGQESPCAIWCDAYEPLAGTEVIAEYRGPAIDGMAAITARGIGGGRVILLGTLPNEGMLRTVIRNAGIVVPGPSEVLEIPRVGATGEPRGSISINLSSAARLHPDGTREMPPYGVLLEPQG